jgi:alcohol dehydrogenase
MAGTRGSAETPGFWPDLIVYKELRIVGALGVDTAAYRQALDLLASGRYPFADLPRETASLDTLEELIRTMAGEGTAPPPVHGVLVP